MQKHVKNIIIRMEIKTLVQPKTVALIASGNGLNEESIRVFLLCVCAVSFLLLSLFFCFCFSSSTTYFTSSLPTTYSKRLFENTVHQNMMLK